MRREKNILQSIWEGKKYPAHQVARKKILLTRNHPPSPLRVKWSAPNSSKLNNKFISLHDFIDAVQQRYMLENAIN